MPGLDRDRAVELKLDGTQDEELYRLLLLAQCNALHQAMPFLFEKIGDETELLLPANLLHTDSLIRQLVEQVDEETVASRSRSSAGSTSSTSRRRRTRSSARW